MRTNKICLFGGLSQGFSVSPLVKVTFVMLALRMIAGHHLL